MRGLEERKQARLRAAEKRLQFQLEAIETEYQARLHDTSSSPSFHVNFLPFNHALICHTICLYQDKTQKHLSLFGKHRSMVKVDHFLQQVVARNQSQADEIAVTNWMEDDLARIHGRSPVPFI